MKTDFASSGCKNFPVFMSAGVQTGSTRQDDKFNVKESKSTNENLCFLTLPFGPIGFGSVIIHRTLILSLKIIQKLLLLFTLKKNGKQIYR
jgi:hypothetical protein